MDLFHKHEETAGAKPLSAPLAERLRPKSIKGFVGQGHLVANGKFIARAIEKRELPSLILWGPPGTGKTTLARIIAGAADAEFIEFSAVLSGVKDVRDAVKRARENLKKGVKTVLFVDEIHRFNKAQQDAFLHSVEDGTITLIGATTENPSFEIISPLLSRCKVLLLNPLSPDEIKELLKNSIVDMERGLGNMPARIDEATLDFIAGACHGDARCALNCLETAYFLTEPDLGGIRGITVSTAEEALQSKALLYDKDGEEHYNVISAFIKSMRASDPDAALYWLARMLEAGEDPLFIARRMLIFASEDVGNADPMAIVVANSVKDSVDFVGMPEGWIPLAQGVAYLSTAPKSNASYTAYLKAAEDVKTHGALPTPLCLRNAPTGLMKDLGYGKGYKYPHNYAGAEVNGDYLPDKLKGASYYSPSDRGGEKAIGERLKKKKG